MKNNLNAAIADFRGYMSNHEDIPYTVPNGDPLPEFAVFVIVLTTLPCGLVQARREKYVFVDGSNFSGPISLLTVFGDKLRIDTYMMDPKPFVMFRVNKKEYTVSLDSIKYMKKVNGERLVIIDTFEKTDPSEWLCSNEGYLVIHAFENTPPNTIEYCSTVLKPFMEGVIEMFPSPFTSKLHQSYINVHQKSKEIVCSIPFLQRKELRLRRFKVIDKNDLPDFQFLQEVSIPHKNDSESDPKTIEYESIQEEECQFKGDFSERIEELELNMAIEESELTAVIEESVREYDTNIIQSDIIDFYNNKLKENSNDEIVSTDDEIDYEVEEEMLFTEDEIEP